MTESGLNGEQREALDNWLLLGALREAYTELHDLAHITAKTHDIDFAHCSLWVCRKNRERLLGWGCDVTALSAPTSDTGKQKPIVIIGHDIISDTGSEEGKCHADRDGDCDWEGCPQKVEYLQWCKFARRYTMEDER